MRMDPWGASPGRSKCDRRLVACFPDSRLSSGRVGSESSRLAEQVASGITMGMKTAISVPDEVFEKAEATAKRLRISRSELYSRALQEFLDTHSPDRVTAAWDAVVSELGQPDTSVSAPAARSAFENTEW